MAKMCSNPAETHTFVKGICVVCKLEETDYLYAELSEKEEPKVTYIDITPTWSGILPYLLHLVRNGSAENQKFAEGELNKMAANADDWSKFCKEQNKNVPL